MKGGIKEDGMIDFLGLTDIVIVELLLLQLKLLLLSRNSTYFCLKSTSYF